MERHALVNFGIAFVQSRVDFGIAFVLLRFRMSFRKSYAHLDRRLRKGIYSSHDEEKSDESMDYHGAVIFSLKYRSGLQFTQWHQVVV
jgi:hypothetical protein